MGKPQVVIVRKDKKIRHKLLHAVAFAVTGGASSVVTAAEAANHASYNARTKKLAGDTPAPAPRGRRGGRMNCPGDAEAAQFRAEHVPSSREYQDRAQAADDAPTEVQQIAAQAKARGHAAQINAMSGDELRELVTMPDGSEYSYWRHGMTMTAQQRVVLGAASRRLHKLERS